MPRMDKLSNYRTNVMATNGVLTVIYASTPIVQADAHTITLDSGGWKTVTTKRKMNQAARQFGLQYSVYQKDFDWFVVKPDGETIPFEDLMVFERRQ